MSNILYLVRREFRQFRSNSVAMAIFLGAPILYGLLFGYVYSDAKVTEQPIVVVDLDNTPLSHRIVEALEDNENLHIEKLQYSPTNLRDDLIRREYVAIITIPDRFEADVQQKRHPEISVDINTSNILTANFSSRGIQTVLGTLNAGIEIEALKKQGMTDVLARQRYEAFQATYNRFFNPSGNYLQFMWPGMIATIMQQVFLLVMALSFAKEYNDNTLPELLQHSRSPLKITLVKSIPYWIMGAGLWWLVLGGMFPLFRIPLAVDWGALLVLIVLFTLALTFLGILVSLALKDQLRATEILMVLATPSFVISGFTWPMSQMPGWVKLIADIIPLTHFLEAFRRLLVYGAELRHITPQLQALGIITVVSFILTLVLLQVQIRRVAPTG
ncbi:MAG TPA: ABC transporter permease [Pontibacter sp.]